MAITLAELLAAKSSGWFNSFSFGDGRGNYSPEAKIAILRGARFDGTMPLFYSDMVKTEQAMKDLAEYLGFANTFEYNSAVLTEQNDIFYRAPTGPLVEATDFYPFPIHITD